MSYNTTTVEPWHFEANQAIRGMLVYHTLGMWWAAMAIVALGYFVISSAVGQWYFNTGKYLEHSRKKKKGVYDKNPTNCFCCKISCIQQIESPVFDSCKIVCSKHCGSIAC